MPLLCVVVVLRGRLDHVKQGIVGSRVIQSDGAKPIAEDRPLDADEFQCVINCTALCPSWFHKFISVLAYQGPLTTRATEVLIFTKANRPLRDSCRRVFRKPSVNNMNSSPVDVGVVSGAIRASMRRWSTGKIANPTLRSRRGSSGHSIEILSAVSVGATMACMQWHMQIYSELCESARSTAVIT